MPNNLQFVEDPDDVPFLNETSSIYVSVNGNDFSNNGTIGEPFRTLGKAVDVIRNKEIGKNNLITIQLGEMYSMSNGGGKKYFEEEEVRIDFPSARRVKIKGQKPTDHEVLAINYFDKASDRDGYYCQVLVTNQDKIAIGNYLAIYDHIKIRKKDPSHFWIRNNIKSPRTRAVTTNNCYVESIRCDMILGVHEVVDISPSIQHDGIYENLSTEIFHADGLKIGAVTLYIKNSNHTYNNLERTPYWNTLGTKGGIPLYSYGAGAGNSPLESKLLSNTIPPIFYGAEMLSNPQTLDTKNVEQFWFSSPVQQIEVVDILVRGYKYSLSNLSGKIKDPRTGKNSNNVASLWNDKTLLGEARTAVAASIAAFLYKKMSKDLRIEADLPFYFGKSNDPFIDIEQIQTAAVKIRDYLLAGAKSLVGVPPWDEGNHPGYGFGPFESGGVLRPPLGGGTDDTSSYPPEYADTNKISLLLRSYNIYPPINGQLYQPTLVKRIKSWYNDNGSRFGLQLDRFNKKGNQSPFFCGYITPQGWYKQRYVTNPFGTGGHPTPSLSDTTDPNGYHRLFGEGYPNYIGNENTIFTGVSGGAKGAFSNERSSVLNMSDVDQSTLYFETQGLTSGGYNPGNTSDYKLRGSMGSVWYSGLVNFLKRGTGVGLGKIGDAVFDRYSFGYETDGTITPNDNIRSKTSVDVDNGPDIDFIYGSETTNIRAKCFKTVIRFGKNGLKITNKTKLGLLKDVCIVGLEQQQRSSRTYGISVDQESVLNATNIAVSNFSCGISSRNQSLINLLANLGVSSNSFNKGFFEPLDPGAVVSSNDIGIESVLKSHINAQRTVSSGSKKANYLAVVNSSMNCSNSMSVASHKHGYVVDFNSYMNAVNTFSEFNAGIGYCASNNSILVCHRSRSIWNGFHGLFASTKSIVKCYEFISRSNDGDGLVAENGSLISAGANSSKFANYRTEILQNSSIFTSTAPNDYYGIWASVPPHLFQVTVNNPGNAPLPIAAASINSNPTHGTDVFYHECNSTISEFNSGSGFASSTDSLIVADNTISRYNSKKYGEFFVYGWSGLRGSFPTDTFAANEFIP